MIKETVWNQDEIPRAYPYLTKDCQCEVAVIGGGLTGALCAWHLRQEGHDVLLLTDRLLGVGGTAASIGVSCMDHEDGLQALIREIGPSDALQAYRAAQSAVLGIEKIVCGREEECGFSRKPGVLFTRDEREAGFLRGEFELLSRNDFNVEWLDEGSALFEFSIAGAILFHAGYAQCNPYRTTHYLIEDSRSLRVYENTRVTQIRPTSAGIRLQTEFGPSVRAKTVVVATGEAPQSLRPYTYKQRYGMIATLPAARFAQWHQQAVLREHLSGCIIRAEAGRILFSAPGSAIRSRAASLISKKSGEFLRARGLRRRLEEFFPKTMDDLSIAHTYDCHSLKTLDGMPIIGPAPDAAGVYTVCGYGDDGGVAGVLAGRLLISWLRGEMPPLGRLYDPERFFRA